MAEPRNELRFFVGLAPQAGGVTRYSITAMFMGDGAAQAEMTGLTAVEMKALGERLIHSAERKLGVEHGTGN